MLAFILEWNITTIWYNVLKNIYQLQLGKGNVVQLPKSVRKYRITK